MAAVITAEAEASSLFGSECVPANDSLANQLPEEIAKVLEGLDLQTTTLGQVRAALESNLGLQSGSLDEHREAIRDILQERIQEMQNTDNHGEASPMDGATDETPPPKSKDREKKRRRLMEAAIRLAKKCRRGDGAGAGAVVVEQPELDGVEGPLEVHIGGVPVNVPLKTLYSGRRGFHVYQPVTVTLGGRQVELNCLVTCAVNDCKDLAVLQAELAGADSKDGELQKPQDAAEPEALTVEQDAAELFENPEALTVEQDAAASDDAEAEAAEEQAEVEAEQAAEAEAAGSGA